MCNHLASAFNSDRANAFAERLLNALNEGALCVMTSVGHRTGLFDTLTAYPHVTSSELAERANLNERYVREWLAAMTVAGVIEYSAEASTYHLPAEHSSVLGRTAGADNIATFAQYIPLMGTVEDDIIACFKKGGGVPYTRYVRFHQVMAEDSGQTVLSALLDHILPLIPDGRARLEMGSQVLDVGCGSGRALNLLAETFPNSHFTGYDISAEAIGAARTEARQKGLGNVAFVERDLSDFDHTADAERFDLVTAFDAIHDQGRPRAVLKGIHRTLKTNGVYLMQDVHSSSRLENNLDHPVGTLLYAMSCMHCTSVSLAQGGEGLGTMWGREKAEELLREAGFEAIEVHQLPHDFQNDYYVIRKQ